METLIQTYSKEIIMLLMIWVLPWKGVALWKAVKRGDKKWFIVLLAVNSLALLEILYIFIFSKRGNSKVE